MNSAAAQSIFATTSAPKKRSSKEEQPSSFKGSNDSLVRRNILLKQQLAEATKTIEKLRDENLILRQRNQKLTDISDKSKIELIVEQQVKNKLSHAAVLNRKLLNVLRQTGTELDTLFKDFEPEPSTLKNKRMPKLEANLNRLDESPIRSNVRQNDEMEIENDEPTFPLASSSVQNLEDGTPRKKFSNGKGRRSELFQNFNLDETATTGELPSSHPAAARRAPMVIAPTATPSAPISAKKRAAPKSSTRRRAISEERFKKPSTPAPSDRPDEPEVTDTVRRQRMAKTNIKSLKEPSLGAKLRRPGKHDEPMPYIDTFF